MGLFLYLFSYLFFNDLCASVYIRVIDIDITLQLKV